MLDSLSRIRTNLLCKLPVLLARRMHRRSAGEIHSKGCSRGERQLLIDVSTIIRNDARTGIQRVVRAIFLQLLRCPPAGFRVRPVFATRKLGYHYAPENATFAFPGSSGLAGSSAVSVRPGDLFLGLDLAAHILPSHKAELALWKRRGVEINVVVYDLLPVLWPSWFNSTNTRNIRRWLRTLAIFADRLICISNTVRSDLENSLLRKYSLAPGVIPIGVIPLGADIESSMPSRGLPENIDMLMHSLTGRPSILMVGTLEPRKGYDQILEAFDVLWRRGLDVNLVIVGKPGWKTETLQEALRMHTRKNESLFWLSDVSDEFLEMLYAKCAGVIAASHAEGFGLSVIEALYHQKPVIVRDIPVFREIAGNTATFFSTADKLEHSLETWLSSIREDKRSSARPRLTWEGSAMVLLQHLGIGYSKTGHAGYARSGSRPPLAESASTFNAGAFQ